MKQAETRDVIVTQGVTKVYAADGIPVNALAGIDLTIRSGEFTALMGPPARGKQPFSTLFPAWTRLRKEKCGSPEECCLT